MKKTLVAAGLALALINSCTMTNPLLQDSRLPYGAPEFDKIKTEDYLPAFKEAIADGKAEIDAITSNEEAPSFENTILALENAGRRYDEIAGIFYNLLQANTNDRMQDIAQELSPLSTEYGLYISLNEKLFERIKAVYAMKDSLNLDQDQKMLLEKAYKNFSRGGANLSKEDKETYSKYSEQLSLLSLQFGKNVLSATNAYSLNITDSTQLKGLPDFVIEGAKAAADAKGKEGWLFDLSYPSYGPFMQYSEMRDLRKEMYMAYNTKCLGGEFDNTEIVKQIVELKTKTVNLLGYETYADFALEDRMAKNKDTVNAFLKKLDDASIPAAKKEIELINDYAVANGFDGGHIMPWDFSYWSEKYKDSNYSLNDEQLKPYFQLENCINAVFDLAGRLYGLKFNERTDLPVYHPDVKVYDVTDENGRHMALFYADFFPRESKRGGAWMTEFRGQSFRNGEEVRPIISIVTNFTKPTPNTPSLITHDEFSTFLHEFGHALHGMLAEGRYGSLTGTSVTRDFVELPSQIMENWAFEPEYLDTFAKHYQTGEVIPGELIEKIVASRNYLAGYYQVRQLDFGILDMAWHTLKEVPQMGTVEFEKKALAPSLVLPAVPETCISTSFNHIFSGGYSAGYYSYKWAEVLEADAFSLFKEKGIFNREVANSFRENILSKGGSEDADVLYRNFRGHDPQPEALLEKLGITSGK